MTACRLALASLLAASATAGCAGVRPPAGGDQLALGHAEVQLHQARETLEHTNAELEAAREELREVTEALRAALARIEACADSAPTPAPAPVSPP